MPRPSNLNPSRWLQNGILASGAKDNVVALYDSKKSPPEYTGLATRFTLPVRHICFNATGSSLAAAGE